MAAPNVNDVFEAYFRRADLDGDGLISGAEAVSLLAGSGLPNRLLAQIWDSINQNKSDYISKEEFYNALKLVTLAQTNRELTTEMVKAALYGPASSTIPVPQINFIPTVSAPAPAADFSSGPSFASTVDDSMMSAGGGRAPNIVHSSVSSVDDAMTSAGGSRAPNIVHSFVSSVDDAMMSAGGDGGRASNIVHSFVSSVDNVMMSAGGGRAPNIVHSFVSSVDDAMISAGGGGGGASKISHKFVSSMDNTMMSAGGGVTSNVHTFISNKDKAIMSRPTDSEASHARIRATGVQVFTMAKIVAATNNFSSENKIGVGKIDIVYKAKFAGGREVAIKRKDMKLKLSESELDLLASLRHKNLVRLVGLCDEKDERLLVYEYMKNGSLYDHLHSKNNLEKNSSVLNSWKRRVQIALDAARGIEYLHNNRHKVHGNIKSSNILLDANWMARVSDIKLTLSSSVRPLHGRNKGGGTARYIDRESSDQNVLTKKSDVYAFGVVLLELLTGKKVLLEHGDELGDIPTTTMANIFDTSVIVFARSAIIHEETFEKILDPRVGPPKLKVEVHTLKTFVGFIAKRCLNSESDHRPTMSDVVYSLERALEYSGHFGDVP